MVLIILCWASKGYIVEAESELHFNFNEESLCEFFYNDPSYIDGLIERLGLVTPYCGSVVYLLSTSFIGTKWCGLGDSAENPDDLGIFKQTDMCCRDHDNCYDWIHAKETKYNLTNPREFTSVLCSCDIEFRTCLKEVNSWWELLFAWGIGWGYFNFIKQQCFNESYPASCMRYYKNIIFAKRCERYMFDETRSKIYQWFDLPMW